MGKTVRVLCVVWLFALGGTAWYLGHQTAHQKPDPSALGFLVLGTALLMTVLAGAALMADRRGLPWAAAAAATAAAAAAGAAAAAAAAGGLVSAVVISSSVSSAPDNVDNYYPEIIFVESVVLLVPVVTGIILGAVCLVVRRVMSPRAASPLRPNWLGGP